MTKCLFKLYRECHVLSLLEQSKSVKPEYGSTEFIKTYCSMCIKSKYARAKYMMARKSVFISL